MKQAMIILVAALSVATCTAMPADQVLDRARAFAAADTFPTNKLGIPLCGVSTLLLTNRAELAAQVDSILAAGRISPVNIRHEYPDVLPKTWARIKRDRSDLFPETIAMIDNRGAGWNLAAATRRAFEGLNRGHGFITISRIEEARSFTLKLVGPYIRRHLRSQGKSIVTVDGVNPQQKFMDEVSACLNAPKFAGLQAKLAEIGLDIKVGPYDSVTPSAADLASLQDKIYYGDVKFDQYLKGMLLFCLGTEGYNNFVKRYNAE